MGHYEREYYAKKKYQGIFHAFTAVEEETSQKNAPEEKETRMG